MLLQKVPTVPEYVPDQKIMAFVNTLEERKKLKELNIDDKKFSRENLEKIIAKRPNQDASAGTQGESNSQTQS